MSTWSAIAGVRLLAFQRRMASVWVVGVLLALFAASRLLVWSNSVELDRHDSAGYLARAKTLLALDVDGLAAFSPDATWVFPALTAMVAAVVGTDVETAARTVSYLAGVVLFLATAGVAVKLGSPLAVAAALILLIFNPILLSQATVVMTEPVYVATVMAGLWLLLHRQESPRKRDAAVLAVLFGLAFLNRPEGIVWFGFVPVVELLRPRLVASTPVSRARLRNALLVFIAVSGLLAAPQLAYVSGQMGRFSLNGREVWGLLLDRSSIRSYEEAIYGLDYSPETVNIKYLQRHPAALAELEQESSLQTRGRAVLRNLRRDLRKLVDSQLFTLIGALGLPFVVLGVVDLVERRRRFELVILGGFVAFATLPALAYSVTVPRHYTMIVPLLLVLAGLGSVRFSRAFGQSGWTSLLALACVGAMVWIQLPEIRKAVHARGVNSEYTLASLQDPIAIVRAEAAAMDHRPVIVARKRYLAHYTEARWLPLPYAGYEDLVEYCRRNQVDFLFFEYRLAPRPFVSRFEEPRAVPDFELLFAGKDHRGKPLELYRFLPRRGGPPADADAGADLGPGGAS